MGQGHGILVSVRKRDLSTGASRAGFTDSSGSFVANFAASPVYDIVSGDKVDVYCKNGVDDEAAQTFTVP
jgi:hypothetical protein